MFAELATDPDSDIRVTADVLTGLIGVIIAGVCLFVFKCCKSGAHPSPSSHVAADSRGLV